MKTITKLSLIAATLAVFGASTALADDQQLQNRLAMQRAQNPQGSLRTTTVAIYNVKGLTLGRTASTEQPLETRFELRSNAHGQQFGVFAPVK